MKIVNKYVPTEKQAIAHKASNRYKLYGGAMGGGKTVWLCAEVIELMLQYPGNRAIMCRNTLKDFKDTTLVTLLKFFREFLSEELLVGGSFENGHNKSECIISLKNGSQIKYTGLSDDDGVKTLKSFECGVFALDEASEVSYDNFKVATTRLRWRLPDGSHPAFYGLLASNPEDCWLKDVFVSGKGGSDYLFIPAMPRDNHHNPAGYVDQMVSDMGGDEAFVSRYINGSWDDVATANFVILPSLVEAAVDKVLPTVRKPVMGVDVAREGLDETVIYYGMGNELKDWDYAHQRKIDGTVMRILEMSKKMQAPQRICVDDIGVGGGVTDFLRKYGAKVKGVNVGTRSEDKRFFNLKAELWWYARTQFMDGKVSIPRDEKLIRQLGGVQYRYRGSGKIIVEPKDETKRRLGQSPDRADAFILMLYAAKSISELASDYNRRNSVQTGNLGGGDAYGWDRFYGTTDTNVPEYNYIS